MHVGRERGNSQSYFHCRFSKEDHQLAYVSGGPQSWSSTMCMSLSQLSLRSINSEILMTLVTAVASTGASVVCLHVLNSIGVVGWRAGAPFWQEPTDCCKKMCCWAAARGLPSRESGQSIHDKVVTCKLDVAWSCIKVLERAWSDSNGKPTAGQMGVC